MKVKLLLLRNLTEHGNLKCGNNSQLKIQQYLDMLPQLVKQYNDTKHSSIKMTPIEASMRKNELFTLIYTVI